jgi:hypothetical protein
MEVFRLRLGVFTFSFTFFFFSFSEALSIFQAFERGKRAGIPGFRRGYIAAFITRVRPVGIWAYMLHFASGNMALEGRTLIPRHSDPGLRAILHCYAAGRPTAFGGQILVFILAYTK